MAIEKSKFMDWGFACGRQWVEVCGFGMFMEGDINRTNGKRWDNESLNEIRDAIERRISQVREEALEEAANLAENRVASDEEKRQIADAYGYPGTYIPNEYEGGMVHESGMIAAAIRKLKSNP